MKSKRMTVSELKARVTETGSPFFSHNNMKHSGDTMRNYGCSAKPIEIMDVLGKTRLVYELWRKRPVYAGLHASAYFDAVMFKQVFIKR